MKALTTTSFSLIIGLLFFTTSCIVEGENGPQGDVGPSGPQAKTFNFSLTYAVNETFQVYSGITGFDDHDVLLVYIFSDEYGGEKHWVQLPWMISANTISIWPEFSDVDGALYINTTWADGSSGSPWAAETTLDFKAVLIKSEAKIAYPEVDYSNYEQVKSVYEIME